jgi:hypothetical protein
MKKQLPFLLLVAAAACITHCKPARQNGSAAVTPTGPEKTPGSRMTDVAGALEYEFNMLKNPVTGTIPEGVRAQELEQARQAGMLSRPTASNSYIFQGPNNLGGRTRALEYDVRFDGSTNRVIIAGGVSGGVYKSIDDGATWIRKSSLGDLFSVTALAQDPRSGSQDIWYYAGGEFTGNSASATGATYRGKGVYKSTDNGETWAHLPTSNTGVYESFDHRADYVYKLAVNPVNGHVYMAAADAIYRSTDGGSTWSIVLTSGSGGYFSDMTTDIIITSTGRFYAAFSGTSNTLPTSMPGVWTSTTGASGTWTKIAGAGSGTSPAGWNASGAYGRVVLAYAPSLDSRVFALYWNGTSFGCGAPAPEAELFRWDDGASTWTDLSANLPDETGCSVGNDPFAVQTGYDLVIAVKPDDADDVFIGGTNIYRSTNGFTSTAATTRIGGYAGTGGYALYASSHPDIHCITFRPGVPTTMLCGNDGGIQRTTANLATPVVWSQINTGYRTYQYYYVTIDPRIGNGKVLGGAQDNGSTRNIGGTGTDFELAWGGDGVSVGLSDDISGTFYEYVGSQLGFINRRTSTTALGSSTGITPTGETSSGLFVTLFHLDPDNTQRLYYANDNALYRTTSASTVTSATWTSLTGVATSVGAANDITALATTRGTYSAATASLFIGTSAADVFRLDDPSGVAAATAPVNITGTLPATGYISSISVNPRSDDTVLVTLSNYGVSSIWWTGTANSATPTWTAIEGNISIPSIRSSAIVVNGGTVEYYAGTSVGLYATTTIAGASTIWTQEGSSTVGNAVVSSMALRSVDNTLLVGTHGHGMWSTTILPALPLRFLTVQAAANGNSNIITWKTENESHNRGFEIERMYDNEPAFSNIGFVPAAVMPAPVNNYSFTDARPDLGRRTAQYRLKQVDADGRFSYSPVVTVNRTVKTPFIDYVSLQNGQLYIRVNGENSREQLSLRITDAGGRLLLRRNLPQTTQHLRLPATATGLLTVQLIHADGRTFSRQLRHTN